jgi:hypothetical protein
MLDLIVSKAIFVVIDPFFEDSQKIIGWLFEFHPFRPRAISPGT